MSERPGEEPRGRRARPLPQLLLRYRRVDRCYGRWPPPVAGRARSSVRCYGLWPPPVAGRARSSVPERGVLLEAGEHLPLQLREEPGVDVEPRFAAEEAGPAELREPLEGRAGGLEGESALRGEALRRRAEVPRLQEQGFRLRESIVAGESGKGVHVRLALAPLAGADRENPPASERRGVGAGGRREPARRRRAVARLAELAPHQEAQSGERRDLGSEPQLREGALSGKKLLAVDERDRRLGLRRADVGEEPRAVLEGPRGPRQELQLDVENLRAARRVQRSRRDQSGAPGSVADVDIRDVRGGPLPGASPIDAGSVHLDAAHTRPADPCARPDQIDLVACPERTGEQGPRHHGAESLHGEGAVERQKEWADLRPGGVDPVLGGLRDGLDELPQPLARPRRALDDGRLLQERPGEEIAQFQEEKLAVIRPERGQQI